MKYIYGFYFIFKGIIESVFKECKSGLIVYTKQIYHYCPQLNNYRTILESKVNNNKKIKFVSPTISSPSRKVHKNHFVEVSIKYKMIF